MILIRIWLGSEPSNSSDPTLPINSTSTRPVNWPDRPNRFGITFKSMKRSKQTNTSLTAWTGSEPDRPEFWPNRTGKSSLAVTSHFDWAEHGLSHACQANYKMKSRLGHASWAEQFQAHWQRGGCIWWFQCPFHRKKKKEIRNCRFDLYLKWTCWYDYFKFNHMKA